jgi:hypothetical protein
MGLNIVHNAHRPTPEAAPPVPALAPREPRPSGVRGLGRDPAA